MLRQTVFNVSNRVVRWLHRSRFVRIVGKRLLRRRTVRQPFRGGLICLDAVSDSWAWTGTIRLEDWDRPIQDRLIALSRDRAVFIDVGSNVGVMTLAVALANQAVEVLCIEPNPRSCELLRESIRANRLEPRVSVLEAAATTTDGEVAFDTAASPTGHVAESGRLTREAVDLRRIVETVMAGRPTLMKIDVEGFESLLVDAIVGVTGRDQFIVVMELHARGFNGLGNPMRVLERLAESGATITALNGEPLPVLRSWDDPLTTVQIECTWIATH